MAPLLPTAADVHNWARFLAMVLGVTLGLFWFLALVRFVCYVVATAWSRARVRREPDDLEERTRLGDVVEPRRRRV